MTRRVATYGLYFMYGCGLIFLLLGFTEILVLSPLMLLLTAAFLLIDYKKWNISHLFLVLIIGLVSFTVEAIGVNYGFIFGEYSYGKNLGPKLAGTPLMIGVNWVLLTVASAEIMRAMVSSTWLHILLAGVFMVLWDLMMEPLAPRMNFWEFETHAGVHNSIGWFILALICQIIWQRGSRVPNLPSAKHVFFSQLIFFSSCYLIL